MRNSSRFRLALGQEEIQTLVHGDGHGPMEDGQVAVTDRKRFPYPLHARTLVGQVDGADESGAVRAGIAVNQDWLGGLLDQVQHFLHLLQAERLAGGHPVVQVRDAL